MTKRIGRVLVLGVVAVVAAACASGTRARVAAREARRPLRVGTTSASPPFAFRRGGRLVGLDMDLAIELGHALGRPVEAVDLEWSELFRALAAGRVDVVMAGVTVTPSREGQMAFADPYLRTNVAALVRRGERDRFKSRGEVCASPLDVGVVDGTTSERYVRERCPAMIPRGYQTVAAAVEELKWRRVDVVIHDGPVLLWMLADQEGELAILPTRIADEPIAWVFRRDATDLRDAANAALADMRSDGRLDAILARWIPRREQLESR